MKKVFYSDLDGTLFSYNKKGSYISDGNLEAINNFTVNNYFGIATGRNVLSMIRYFKDNIPVNINLPFVLMNGSCVYDINKDEVIYQDILNKEAVMEAVKYIEDKDYGFLLLIGPKKRFHIGKYDSEKFGDLGYEVEETTLDKLDFSEVAKMNYVINDKYYDIMIEDIKKFEHFDKLELVPASKTYIEFVNKGTSKANGIKIALNYANITNYKLFAIGDFINDFDMLQSADVSFAPSNANIEIKKIVNHIVSDHKEDAVKEAINIIKGQLS